MYAIEYQPDLYGGVSEEVLVNIDLNDEGCWVVSGTSMDYYKRGRRKPPPDYEGEPQ